MYRAKLDAFRQFAESLTEEELKKQNEIDTTAAEAEHAKFSEAFKKGECYLCNKPLKTNSKAHPCVHWLLRECKCKKKDFPNIFKKFGYVNIAAYLRWVANEEKPFRNINDLAATKKTRKIFEYTIRWKNIEWTFDCSKNDYSGHGGANSDFPHYHFQMRVDGRPFINFNDFHIPFDESDLFHLDLYQELPEYFNFSFGEPGAGMQAASEYHPDYIVNESEFTEDENMAVYDLSTMILAGEKGFEPSAFLEIYEEAKKTGKTIASLAPKYFGDASSINTILSPTRYIEPISKRSARKRRS